MFPKMLFFCVTISSQSKIIALDKGEMKVKSPGRSQNICFFCASCKILVQNVCLYATENS